MSQSILGVSLGMVVIDEIRVLGNPPIVDIIGGSGTFFTAGLRLFTPFPPDTGCLVLAGDDFPAHQTVPPGYLARRFNIAAPRI